MAESDIFFADESLSVVEEWLKRGQGSERVANISSNATEDSGMSARQGLGSNLEKKRANNSQQAPQPQKKVKSLDLGNVSSISHGIVEDDLEEESRSKLFAYKRAKSLVQTLKSEPNVAKKSSPAAKLAGVPTAELNKVSKPATCTAPKQPEMESKIGTPDGDTSIESRPKRQRKKTRSKQKNIRRDNRSAADRPDHLNVGSKTYAGRPLTQETKAVLGLTK